MALTQQKIARLGIELVTCFFNFIKPLVPSIFARLFSKEHINSAASDAKSLRPACDHSARLGFLARPGLQM